MLLSFQVDSAFLLDRKNLPTKSSSIEQTFFAR